MTSALSHQSPRLLRSVHILICSAIQSRLSQQQALRTSAASFQNQQRCYVRYEPLHCSSSVTLRPTRSTKRRTNPPKTHQTTKPSQAPLCNSRHVRISDIVFIFTVCVLLLFCQRQYILQQKVTAELEKRKEADEEWKVMVKAMEQKGFKFLGKGEL